MAFSRVAKKGTWETSSGISGESVSKGYSCTALRRYCRTERTDFQPGDGTLGSVDTFPTRRITKGVSQKSSGLRPVLAQARPFFRLALFSLAVLGKPNAARDA